MNRFFATALVAMAAAGSISAQGVYTWNASQSGGTGGSGTAWLRNAGAGAGASENWVPAAGGGGTAGRMPGIDANASTTIDGNANDIAVYNTIANLTSVIGMSNSSNNGVTANGAANGRLQVGAVQNASAGNFSLTLNASSLSPTPPGILQLNGAFAGNTASLATNTVLAATNGNITIDRGGTNFLEIELGVNAIVNAGTGRTITLNTMVGQTGGTRSLTKEGTGTLVLNQFVAGTGTSTYAGGTTINAGTVQANYTGTGNNSTGTGAITVNNGGTLAGTGNAIGNVTVNQGGRVIAGLGTAVNQTLTVGTANAQVVTFDQGTFFRAAVATGSGLTDNTLTGASRLSMGTLEITTDLLTSSGGTQATSLNLELVGTGLANGTYQRTIGTFTNLGGVISNALVGNAVTLVPSDQATITPIGFSIDQATWSIVIDNNSKNVIVNFTVVPEPATVLGLTAFIAFGGAAIRRKLRRA
jgi:fibronectin-binding autotransporter adhesin